MTIRFGHRPIGLVLALLAGTAAVGVTLASASGLPGADSGLGAGGLSVSSCTAGPITVAYETAFTPGTGYTVGSVSLSGIDFAACAGKAAEVTLSDPAGAALAQGSVTVPSAGLGTGSVLTVPLTGVAPVGNIARADVVLG